MVDKLIKVNGEADLNGTKIKVIEGGFGEGNKAILFSDVANKHEVEPKYINNLIESHIERYTYDDVINLCDECFKVQAENLGLITSNAQKYCYILSERGYIKLVSSMSNANEKKWEVMNEIIDNYFNMRKTIKNNNKSKKPRQKKVVKDRIADYTITGMRKTLENSKYFEIEKNINNIIEYHRNLSIKSRDKAYQNDEFKDKTKYVNVIKTKIIKILENIRNNSKSYALNAVMSEIIENLLKELKTSNNISSSIKIKNLKNAIEKKDNAILLLNPPMSKFLDLEFYGFSFNKMYAYYKNNKAKRTKEYNNWMFDFPYDKVVASFNDVDLTRPAAMFVKYTAPASSDIDNFVKSTQDAVAGALGCNDNKIHKVNAERIGYCDKIEDGKILVYLRNLTSDEINENQLIIK